MHIGFLTSEYPGISKQYGGIATSIKNLTMVLLKDGHSVSIVLYGQDSDAVVYMDGAKVIKVRNREMKGLSWFLTRKKIEKIINNEVEKNGLELIEAADWTGITAFMKLKCPVLVKLHGSDTYFCHIENRKQKYKNFLFEKYALTSADAIVSVSHYTAELTKKLFSLDSHIHVIHNGIDPSVFKPPLKEEIVPGRLLYFGTLIRKKGVLELPLIFNKVVEKFPEATLYLIGGDAPDITTTNASTWELMKPLFSDKALQQTSYLGKVPHEAMQKHIKQAQVCVFPSFAEAFPISWLEAMAMAKPIVGSDKGWAEEAIENGKSGLLCSPKDHEGYAKSIEHLLADEVLALELGQGARKRVETLFDARDIANQNIEYYRHVVEENKL